jgi:anti-anti-sigma factor
VSVLRVIEELRGDVPVVQLVGEIDASNVPELGVRLRELVTNRSAGLVIDLSGTVYLDSAGINLLFAIGAELAARQLKLHLVVSSNSPIARMLAVSSLDRVHPVHESADAALAP